jgi:hypothetical protein
MRDRRKQNVTDEVLAEFVAALPPLVQLRVARVMREAGEHGIQIGARHLALLTVLASVRFGPALIPEVMDGLVRISPELLELASALLD